MSFQGNAFQPDALQPFAVPTYTIEADAAMQVESLCTISTEGLTNDLLGLDYGYLGQPFCIVAPTDSQFGGLDTSYLGQPLYLPEFDHGGIAVEWTTEREADAVIPVESRGLLSADGEIPAEWLETVSAVTVDGDGALPVEWLANLTADAEAPTDWQQQLAADHLESVEWLANLTADHLESVEWLANLTAEHLIPFESGAGLTTADAQLPVESRAGLTADGEIPVDELIEVSTGFRQVHGFVDSAAPPAGSADNDYELGTIFNVQSTGYITGLRFYRLAGGPSTSTGRLWDYNTQTLLASAAYTISGTGWQEVAITPVAVVPSVDYVVSFNVGVTDDYASEHNYFDSLHTEGYIQATFGVYNNTPGVYPDLDFLNSLYWADVVFERYAPTIPVEWRTSIVPDEEIPTEWLATAATAIDADGGLPVEWLANLLADAQAPVEFRGTLNADAALPLESLANLTAEGSAPVESLASLLSDGTPPAEWRTSIVPDGQFPTEWTGAVVVDADGALQVEWLANLTAEGAIPFDWSVLRLADAAIPFENLTEIDTGTDAVSLYGTPGGSLASFSYYFTLGTQWRCDSDGYVTKLRFYKPNANTTARTLRLWSTGGVSLASVVVTPSSTVGWHEGTLSSPYPITAGTEYIVSYTTEAQAYQDEDLSPDVDYVNGHLTAIAYGGRYNSGYASATGEEFPDTPHASGKSFYADVVVEVGPGALPAEWRSSLTADETLPVEALAGLAADGEAPVDWLASLSADGAIPVDWLLGLTADAQAPVESLATLAADGRIPCEWTGAILVEADGEIPVEWRVEVAADGEVPVTWSGLLTAEAEFPAEILVARSNDAPLAAEWRASIAADAEGQVEWRGEIAADAEHALEWRAERSAEAQLAVENLIACTLDAQAAVEWRGSIGADAQAPVTWSGTLAADAAIPVEWRVTTQSAEAQLNVDWRQGVAADATLLPAWIGTLLADARIPWESDGINTILETGSSFVLLRAREVLTLRRGQDSVVSLRLAPGSFVLTLTPGVTSSATVLKVPQEGMTLTVPGAKLILNKE